MQERLPRSGCRLLVLVLVQAGPAEAWSYALTDTDTNNRHPLLDIQPAPAIHAQYLSGHIAGIADQEQGRAGQVLG